MKNRVLSTLVILMMTCSVFAQEVEMADNFRAEGKIYVVVGVILIILFGFFGYMFRIERKVKKLEDQ